MKSLFYFLTCSMFFSISCSHKHTSTALGEDPFIKLEDIRSAESMAWVKNENEISSKHLKSNPEFNALKMSIKDILASKERIPYVSITGDFIYNHWTDEKNPRGLWRRTKTIELGNKQPNWETLLDVDALGKIENESWVLKRVEIQKPESKRALIFLSRKGKDATVMREFDIPSKAFVADGFSLPESKMTATWMDKNTLLVGADFGSNSMTDSGYPRMIKSWSRNQKIVDARLVLETASTNMGLWGSTYYDGTKSYTIIDDRMNFFEGDSYLFGADGNIKKLPLPKDAEIEGVFQGAVYFLAKSELKARSRTFPAGSLMKLSLTQVMANTNPSAEPELVFSSRPNQIYSRINFTKNKRWITLLNQVNPNIFELTLSGKLKALKLPVVGNSSVMSASDSSDEILLTYSNFNQPTTLYGALGGTLKKVQSLPAFFKANEIIVEQKWATSKDGTRVPYYLVRNRNLKNNSKNPTLLYAYGGFEIAMSPNYSGVMGKAWLESGGTYVLANIRGGGEFGPGWHQSALKLNRQRAFDDFYAVAEDLIQKKITSAQHLGIMGGSNGGLLMGVALTQRPDLFRAVLCEVPLLDMSRFHLLLAGASWVAEYGSPNVAKEKDFLLSYSPYQNLKKSQSYPDIFITTSTEDDRVHPGHARKMAAKLKSMEKPYLYFENTEGGHGRTADLNQAAEYMAMQYIFLKEKLF